MRHGFGAAGWSADSRLVCPSRRHGRQADGCILNLVNAAANRRVADLLELGGEQRVLELGFGGGAAIASTVARLDQTGDLYAVDLSPDMAGQARKAFADLVDSGRLHFACADVTALPLRASTLDHAYAIHSHMYWPNPLAGVKEFRRVLRPGGRGRSPARFRRLALNQRQ